jgi:Ni/Fe-hydrogenase subunit HybB-like protein
MDLPHDALVNYIFPNNEVIWWSILIVIYPYITGLIAGAFVVSGLSHVFKVKEFKPIANFALIAAFSFGLFAAVPLLLHLGQPQRALEIYFTPHLTSAMSIFGYIYGSYLILLMLEIWLIYRPHFILKFNETTGFQKVIWYILTLGVTTYHPDSIKIDQKFALILAGIGIPWAFVLHGYVGFVFGSVKAIAWWASPLQPIVFLLSAIVSGMAMIIVMYTFIKWRSREAYDYPMIKKFITYLWGIFILAFALELLEVLFARYENSHHWSIIEPLLNGPLFGSYVITQVLLLSFIPAVLLGYVALSKIQNKTMLYLANLGSFMLVMQVLFMRFNVVVGGQLISKSERGFVDYDWEIFGKEGVLVSALILAAPFVTFYVISRFLPIFKNPGSPESTGS